MVFFEEKKVFSVQLENSLKTYITLKSAEIYKHKRKDVRPFYRMKKKS